MSPTLTPYQAVLFDLDGTLLDTAPDFARVLNTLLRTHQREPLPESDIRAIVSDGSAAMIARAFNCSPRDKYFDTVRSEFLALYLEQVCVKTQPFPGIETVLAELDAAQLPWGIVTNKPERYTLPLMEALALKPTPQTLICPEHVTHSKPHPESVLLACEHLGSDPRHTVFIGDHQRDIDAGRAAGATTVAATYGYIDPEENIKAWNADHMIDCAAELLPIIF